MVAAGAVALAGAAGAGGLSYFQKRRLKKAKEKYDKLLEDLSKVLQENKRLRDKNGMEEADYPLFVPYDNTTKFKDLKERLTRLEEQIRIYRSENESLA